MKHNNVFNSSIEKIKHNLEHVKKWNDTNSTYKSWKLENPSTDKETKVETNKNTNIGESINLIDFSEPSISNQFNQQDEIVQLYKEIRERKARINNILQDMCKSLKYSRIVPEVMYTQNPYKNHLENVYIELCNHYNLQGWVISYTKLKECDITLPNFVNKTLYVNSDVLNKMTYNQIYIICLKAVADILSKID